jgi:hypothetical protein
MPALISLDPDRRRFCDFLLNRVTDRRSASNTRPAVARQRRAGFRSRNMTVHAVD